ncbi:MAG: flagellar biosynthetic protein FliO [Succinivibrio sp.]|nr:flagellar biosynthetic protein FliO [Succinivibrio sp.]
MLQRLFYVLLMLPLLCAAAGTDQAASSSVLPSSPTENTLFGGLASWFFSTMAIVGLIMFLGYLLKKSKFAINKRTGELYLETQMAVGPKERLMIINVRGRSILVGVTAHQISYLTDLSSSEGKSFGEEFKRSQTTLQTALSAGKLETAQPKAQDETQHDER